MSEPIDEERVNRIIEPILVALRENYIAGPMSRDRVYESLNALAFCAAWVIRGCDRDPDAILFFSKAFEMNLTSDE